MKNYTKDFQLFQRKCWDKWKCYASWMLIKKYHFKDLPKVHWIFPIKHWILQSFLDLNQLLWKFKCKNRLSKCSLKVNQIFNSVTNSNCFRGPPSQTWLKRWITYPYKDIRKFCYCKCNCNFWKRYLNCETMAFT